MTIKKLWNGVKILPTIFIPVGLGSYLAIKYNEPMLAFVVGFPLVSLLMLIFFWKEL